MKRILTAVLLLPVFIFVVVHENPWFFTLFLAAVAVLTVNEIFDIAEATGFKPFRKLGLILTLTFLASAVWPDDLHQEWIIALALFLLSLATLRKGVRLEDALGAAASTFFAVFLVGFLLGYLVALKSTDPERGKDLIFLLTVIVWAGDTSAYYVGKTFGKHKLAPRLSPKKTREGSLAYVAGSLVAAAIASVTFIHRIQGMHVVALGLIISVVGQIGDLCESAVKRGGDVKDSSSILPGHGGMFDRLDSLLFNAPVMYYYHQVLLQ